MFHIVFLDFLLNSQVEYLDDNILKWIPELNQPVQLTFPFFGMLRGCCARSTWRQGPVALTDLGDDSLEEVSIFSGITGCSQCHSSKSAKRTVWNSHVPRMFGWNYGRSKLMTLAVDGFVCVCWFFFGGFPVIAIWRAFPVCDRNGWCSSFEAPLPGSMLACSSSSR